MTIMVMISSIVVEVRSGGNKIATYAIKGKTMQKPEDQLVDVFRSAKTLHPDSEQVTLIINEGVPE